MREEDEEELNWFSRWEEELPSPEELTPLSQTLITPDLALAFDIPTSLTDPSATISIHHRDDDPSLPPPTRHPPPLQPDFELPETRGGTAPENEPARTLKRPRLVWTPQLHKRFVDAVGQLGIKNAVPKTIMQLMNVEGLTRENVASHLQKYRLYIKRVQQDPPAGAGAGSLSAADAAADYLFASTPVPHHFLGGPGPPRGGGAPDQFMPFGSVASLQHHHRQSMAAVAAAAVAHPQQQQYYPQGHMGHLARQQQQQPGNQRGVGHALYLDPDSEEEEEERKVLTLFPTGEEMEEGKKELKIGGFDLLQVIFGARGRRESEAD